MCVINKIINELKKKELKQIDLVRALNSKSVTEVTISDWKKGKSNSYYPLLPQIATFLNVTTDYLLGLTDDPRPLQRNLTEKDKLEIEISKLTPEKYKQAEQFVQFLKTQGEFSDELNDISNTVSQKPLME